MNTPAVAPSGAGLARQDGDPQRRVGRPAVSSAQTFLLPWPPSTNDLWRAVKGRNILSARARAWKKDADLILMASRARMIDGPVAVTIELCPGDNRVFDLDNFQKAALDVLKGAVIPDDNCRHVKRITTELGEGFVGARITVAGFAP